MSPEALITKFLVLKHVNVYELDVIHVFLYKDCTMFKKQSFEYECVLLAEKLLRNFNTAIRIAVSNLNN